MIEVSDTGIGLSPAEAELVFDRFFRSSRSLAQQVPGTGLGLFISRAIAEAHGGAITVSSREGGGTTFRVELPSKAAPQPESAARGARRMSEPEVPVDPVVLVADDDDDILLLVTTRLRRDGFEVLQASNGDRALELARERRPDIAVLDIGMPGLDGLQVLEQIRADEELRGMLVVLLTAKAQESDVRRGYETGADAYIKKPFSPTELSTKVRELLDGEQSSSAPA